MKTRTAYLGLSAAALVLSASLFSVAMAQSAGAIAGSTSGSTSGASAGAAGIIIGGGASPVGTVGATGTTGTTGDSISAFSPVGVGVGGSSGASANSSPTIVVGSGNNYEAADLGDAVPTMFVPNLTTSNGTCMGSFSTGLTLSGFGGAVGKTYTSDPCNRRFDYDRVVAQDKDIAFQMMCASDSVYQADLEVSAAKGTKQRCFPRSGDEITVDPVVSMLPKNDGITDDPTVDMKWFEQDPETGSFSVIEVPDEDTAMLDNTPYVWGGQYDEPDVGSNR